MKSIMYLGWVRQVRYVVGEISVHQDYEISCAFLNSVLVGAAEAQFTFSFEDVLGQEGNVRFLGRPFGVIRRLRRFRRGCCPTR